jgi:hypothetical protein
MPSFSLTTDKKQKQAIILLCATILMSALMIVLLGCLFWSGREIIWADEIIEQQTQHILGVAFVVLGVLLALFSGLLFPQSRHTLTTAIEPNS